MDILKLCHVTKSFPNGANGPINAVEDVNLSFSTPCFVSIVGKSGSGKSTIGNMISLLSKPTSGNILFKGRDISESKPHEVENYRNENIGMVFQHYDLVEHESVLWNVMSPMLIKGQTNKAGEREARVLLEGMGIPEECWKKPSSTLSGGEKQRVALARALINDPDILIADEPTGALDTASSDMVMEILHNLSAKRLVILISHNLALVKKHSDRIIVLKDGKVQSDTYRKGYLAGEPYPDRPLIKRRKSANWVSEIAGRNLKRRIKRNVFSALAFTFSLTALTLIIGFSNGASSSLKEEAMNRADLGTMSLSRRTTTKIAGSRMSLTHISRFSDLEADSIMGNIPNLYYDYSMDVLVPASSQIESKGEKLDGISYTPIGSFSSINGSIKEGGAPKEDSLYEVMVNPLASELIKSSTGRDSAIGALLTVHSEYTLDYPTGKSDEPYVTDVFSYRKDCIVKGIYEEFFFLSSPKVFYHYPSLVEEISSLAMPNISRFLNRKETWYSYIASVSGDDSLSSYSHKAFLLDATAKSLNETYVKLSQDETVSVESGAMAVSEAFISLVDVGLVGMGTFVGIAIIGTVLLVGIVSFSSYTEDKKEIAILYALGCPKDKVVDIYATESLLVGLFSLVVSMALSPLFGLIINAITGSSLGTKGFIDIPFRSYMGVPFLLPLLLFISVTLVSIVSTWLPIAVSGKIDVIEELREE